MNFEQFLQQKSIIPKGIARHQREVGKYEIWLERTHDRTPENATKKDLLEYLQYIKEKRKLANATQNSILQKLKNYHAYLAKEYEINDITCLIKIRGTKRQRLRPLFTPDELDLLWICQQINISNNFVCFIDFLLSLSSKKRQSGRHCN